MFSDAEGRKGPPPAPAPRIDLDTRLRDLRICTQGITWSKVGTALEGMIFTASDPIVLEVPQAFRPLSERLG
jgi:hypothetical protein